MASEDCLGEDSSVRDTFSLIFLSVLGTCPQIHKQKCGCVAHMDFHTHRHQKPLESLPGLLWRPYSLSGLHNWQPYSLSVRVAQQQSLTPCQGCTAAEPSSISKLSYPSLCQEEDLPKSSWHSPTFGLLQITQLCGLSKEMLRSLAGQLPPESLFSGLHEGGDVKLLIW